MILENWSVVTENDPYMAPEMRKRYLCGEVYGHPRFEAAHSVKTSSIVNIDVEAKTIETKSGSIYTLGEVDPDYERAYPGAVERVWTISEEETV